MLQKWLLGSIWCVFICSPLKICKKNGPDIPPANLGPFLPVTGRKGNWGKPCQYCLSYLSHATLYQWQTKLNSFVMGFLLLIVWGLFSPWKPNHWEKSPCMPMSTQNFSKPDPTLLLGVFYWYSCPLVHFVVIGASCSPKGPVLPKCGFGGPCSPNQIMTIALRPANLLMCRLETF